MNIKRGKALTGEFKNEVLHFGRLISRIDNLVFFSAVLGGNSSLKCIAVVLDDFDSNVSTIFPKDYANKINILAGELPILASILELGITPDNKPFFISEEPVGPSLDEKVFSEIAEFKDFFNDLYGAVIELSAQGLAFSVSEMKLIYPESKSPMLFPSVRMLMVGDQQVDNIRAFKEMLIRSIDTNQYLFPNSLNYRESIYTLQDSQVVDYINNLGPEGVVRHDEKKSILGMEGVGPAILNRSLGSANLLWSKVKSLSPKLQVAMVVLVFVILFLISGHKQGEKQPQVIDNKLANLSAEKIVETPVREEKVVDPAGVENIPEGSRTKDIEKILSYIQGLGKTLEHEQIQTLIDSTKSSDFEVRIACIRTLGEKAPKGMEEVRSALIASLSDEDYLVRGFAVTSLTAYLEAESISILEVHKQKEDSEIVVSAIDRAINRLQTLKIVR